MAYPKENAPSAPEPRVYEDGNVLHEIDFENVSISKAALRMIQKAAEVVVHKHMPTAGLKKMSAAQAVAMFVDRLFWEERSGGLIMCSDVKSTSYCLPIPKEHWAMHRTGLVH